MQSTAAYNQGISFVDPLTCSSLVARAGLATGGIIERMEHVQYLVFGQWEKGKSNLRLATAALVQNIKMRIEEEEDHDWMKPQMRLLLFIIII